MVPKPALHEQPLLRMTGIDKAFGGVPALVDVRLELFTGEVHVLAGENGAGKSTLIKILSGVLGADRGAIELEGRPISPRSPQHAAALGIAAIHQELSLVGPLSVAENLFLGRELCGPGGWVRFGRQVREARAILARMGLEQLDVRRPAAAFPLAVQQMIEIGKALALKARVLIMDEPTSALTAPEAERLFALIAELKAQGCAIVYISHKMDEIYRIADRLTVLRDGRFVGSAPAARLPRAELVRWMVGREIDAAALRAAPPPGPVRLRVEGLSLPDPGGKPVKAIDDVSLQVRAGEILGLAGLQGSGASELLGAIFGVYGRAAQGRVLVDGEPLARRSPAASIRRGLALLTSDRKTTGLVLELSITRNITLASLARFSPLGWLRPRREADCAAAQQRALRIKAARLSLPVASLSGGNQQKVALAKWLQIQPRVLLLDEPTRGVDIGAKQEIYQLMNQWSADGYAIVLITSEMPELLALADRILVLHRGRVTAELGRAEATQEAILQAAMGRMPDPAHVGANL